MGTLLNRPRRPDLLRLLADFIENQVPDSGFDMSEWCGTSKCAMGWAPSVPEIAAEGLYISKVSNPRARLNLGEPAEFESEVLLPQEVEDLIAEQRPSRYITPFERAEYVFGISERESEYCFNNSVFHRFDLDNTHNTMAAVAERLRITADLAEVHDG